MQRLLLAQLVLGSLGLLDATRLYHVGPPSAYVTPGPSLTTGSVVLHYNKAEPPVTEFSYDQTERWQGPPVTIMIEPDNRPGEFHLADLHGKHTESGLLLNYNTVEVCLKFSGLIYLSFEKGQVGRIDIDLL